MQVVVRGEVICGGCRVLLCLDPTGRVTTKRRPVRTGVKFFSVTVIKKDGRVGGLWQSGVGPSCEPPRDRASHHSGAARERGPCMMRRLSTVRTRSKTGGMTLSEEDRRLVGVWAADCAERVLPLFEAKAPSDTRPRQAIEGIRAFALEGKRTGRLRSLAWAAYAAAREVGDPVATAAARAAGLAAATAYLHALATPHQANHVLGPATYGARARELAAVDDPSVGAEEIRWAIEHASPAVRAVVRRMPVRGPGRSRLGALLYQLDAGLRR